MIRVLGLALYGPKAASHRIRLAQYRPGLLDSGIDLEVHSLLDDTYLVRRSQGVSPGYFRLLSKYLERVVLLTSRCDFDLVLIHCELLPLLPAWVEACLIKTPYIYDFDDAWYLRYRVGRFKWLAPFYGSKLDTVIKNATAVTAGSSYLASYAARLSKNVTVLPSVVNTHLFSCHREQIKNGVFTLGWIGSSSTEEYLSILVTPLAMLGEEARLRFVVIGGRAPAIANVEVLELPWDADREVDLIRTLDVGLMPLPDNDWTRGKCAFKLVQYMACGLPVIASRVGANMELVTEECGFLVETVQEWLDSLRWMRDHSIERQEMGIRARARVLEAYSLEKNLVTLAQVIRKVARG